MSDSDGHLRKRLNQGRVGMQVGEGHWGRLAWEGALWQTQSLVVGMCLHSQGVTGGPSGWNWQKAEGDEG